MNGRNHTDYNDLFLPLSIVLINDNFVYIKYMSKIKNTRKGSQIRLMGRIF
jgi:hypothetical protein